MTAYQAPKYDPQRSGMLADLRRAAAAFGLTDRGSVAAWELGASKPRPGRRADFIPYLLDQLGLGRDYDQFQRVWNEIMVELWEWAPLSEGELRYAFPGHDLASAALSLPYPPRTDEVVAQAAELARLAGLLSPQPASTLETIWLLTRTDGPPRRLANGMLCYDLTLVVVPKPGRGG